MNLSGPVHLNRSAICVSLCGALVLLLYMLPWVSVPHDSTLKINLKHLLEVSIRAAQNGGQEVVATKDSLTIKSKGLTKEGLQDSVTTADYLSHCAIMKTLKGAYPALNVISEEEKTDCEENQKVGDSEIRGLMDLNDEWVNINDITVWIDPLDATYEYTGKLYQYVTTMVCVAVKGKPVIGVVHKPFLKDQEQTYWGWVNRTTSTNLKHKESDSDKLKIIVSLSHSGDIKKALSNNMRNFEIISAAGAGYKSIEVALGNADAYLHNTAIKKWDICAGNAIIKSMDGSMTTKYNEIIDYKASTNVKNERGLIATITNHEHYIEKF